MRRININIRDTQNSFKYMMEYVEGSDSLVEISYNYSDNMSCMINNGDINKDNGIVPLKRCKEGWVFDEKYTNYFGEINTKLSKIRVYFPPHSVDTYEGKVNYALDLYTWVAGRKLILGSCMFTRLDALASQPIRFLDEVYYECIELNVLDPWDIMYSDEWADFRKIVMREKEGCNNTGSQLYVSLYPIEYFNEYWMKKEKYEGGQNSINISRDKSDYLKLDLYHNIDEPSTSPLFKCVLSFNGVYINDLNEYIKETYGLENISYRYELIAKDSDDVYLHETNPEIIKEEQADVVYFKNIYFDSWGGWKEGISMVAGLSILDESGEEVLFLKSNEIPLTQQLFSYFVGKNDVPRSVDLNKGNLLNMKIYKIDAINKTEVKTVQIERPSDTKSNIVQPVFFRVRDLSNIIVHPKVTEYIAINLDSYKSQVDTFMIKIEDCTFPEVARNNSGVVFKIIGNKLAAQVSEGVYYILNQDAELVTTGKYKYDL